VDLRQPDGDPRGPEVDLMRVRRWLRRKGRAAGAALGRAVIEQRRFEIMAANVENAERHRKAIRRTRPGR
jgi:hypothetical protein